MISKTYMPLKTCRYMIDVKFKTPGEDLELGTVFTISAVTLTPEKAKALAEVLYGDIGTVTRVTLTDMPNQLAFEKQA